MKKWLSLIIIGSLFLFSSTAMAHGGKGKGHEESHGKSMKECKEIQGFAESA